MNQTIATWLKILFCAICAIWILGNVAITWVDGYHSGNPSYVEQSGSQ